MGWLSRTHATGTKTMDAWWADQDPDRVVLARIRGGAVYSAQRTTDGNVVAVITLYQRIRDTNGVEIAFKDMDEGMGPWEAAAPAAILDALSPVEVLYPDPSSARECAEDWRARCRAGLARDAALKAAIPSIGDTATVRDLDTITPEWAAGATGTVVSMRGRNVVIDLPAGRIRVPVTLLDLGIPDPPAPAWAA